MAQPKLIIFDLDHTLWPFWVGKHVDPPFRRLGSEVFDSCGRHVAPYPDVPRILPELKSQGYTLGLASRTGRTRVAWDLVWLFGWDQYFSHIQIYPGSKVQHFLQFHADSKIPYEDMLFFDDELRNIKDVSRLGVTCIQAKEGMSLKLLQEGFKQFRWINKQNLCDTQNAFYTNNWLFC